ncbi:MAG: peptide chain release factor 1 [bacterium]|nr:peptide chain release factor 1 [bacterium]
MEHLDPEKLKIELAELQAKLSNPAFLSRGKETKEAGQRLVKIRTIIDLAEEIKKLNFEKTEAEKLSKNEDEELSRLAAENIAEIAQKIEEKKAALIKAEKGDEPETTEARTVIMEIRAGTGGEEAALFAAKLYHMYNNFAKRMSWNMSVIDSQRTPIGGIKEIVLEISGKSVYEKLKHESGVHRIQRIPETEKNGRIHTSTASVAVLPEAKEEDVEIKPQDIKFEFFRVSGPGGQNVNKVETGVRITHLPTGVVVSSQETRSQQQNREHALKFLRTKLLDEKRRKEDEKMAKERREQIGTAERVEKIRTYNFPQDRITDHRIKESWHNINSILEGNIDEIIEALSKK